MNNKYENNSVLGFLFLILIVIFFTSCSSIVKMGLREGKEFTYDNKELESKMVFYCTNEKKGENINLRAKKAYDYFNKENNSNIETLTDKMFKKEISSLEFAYALDSLSENLAINVQKKFNCSLIDVIDY